MVDAVLIPGLCSDAAVWSRTIDALGDAVDCTVGDTLQDGSLPDMARRILAAAPPRFVLAGLSMGGMVALEIMRLEPGRVTGLAMVDSTAFPDTAAQAEQRRGTLARVRAGLDLRAAGRVGLSWMVHSSASADVRDAVVEMGVRVGVEIYARQIKAVLNRPDQRSVLAGIAVPSLVITGADDAIFPVSCARAIAAAIPGAGLEIIADCGHLPPIEAPRVVAGLLRGLVGRVAAAESNRREMC